MALVLADRVKETTTTTSTGTITLAGASTGYQSFSVIGNGNTTYYTIAHQTANEWEVGIGTYTSSGTTLARTTVLASSNSGSLVNFSAGTKDVFVTYPAERSVNLSSAALTSGRVPYATTDGLLLDSSNMTFNGTTLTANTIGPFTLSGTIAGGGNQLNNIVIGTSTPLAGSFTTVSASTSVTTPSVTNAGTLALSATGANIVTASTNGSERMRIDSSGNVIIGTTGITSGWKFTVNGSQYSGGSVSSTGSDPNFSAGGSRAFMDWNGTIARIGTVAGGSTGGPTAFFVNGTEYMRIDTSGNVGIGTSSPTATSGIATVMQNATQTSYRMYNGTNYFDLILSGNDAYVYNRNTANLIFGTANTERMRIDSSGNVGIGTSSPSYPLTVVSNSSAVGLATYGRSSDNLAGTYWFSNNGATTYGTILASSTEFRHTSTPAAAVQTFYTNGSERMRIDSSGNVGIGTSSPGATLDVKGTLRLSGSTSGYVGLSPAAAAGSTTYTLPSADGTSGQSLTTNGSGTLSWASASGSAIPTVDVKTSGSSATWTIPAGVTKVRITVVGGGGGAGGYGAGAGAGGAAIKTLTGLTPGNTLTYTVGTGGAAANYPSTGGTGNTSQVSSGTQSITTISATGGSGTVNYSNPGYGGIGSNGDLNIRGGPGSNANNDGSTLAGGSGGNSYLGGGGAGYPGTTAGGAYGGGGASVYATGAGSGSGAAGVIIFEY